MLGSGAKCIQALPAGGEVIDSKGECAGSSLPSRLQHKHLHISFAGGKHLPQPVSNLCVDQFLQRGILGRESGIHYRMKKI
jgi:hypothetical protein